MIQLFQGRSVPDLYGSAQVAGWERQHLHMIYSMLSRLDLYGTSICPAQHLITAGYLVESMFCTVYTMIKR